jgi:hypothetical protein
VNQHNHNNGRNSYSNKKNRNDDDDDIQILEDYCKVRHSIVLFNILYELIRAQLFVIQ